MPPLLIWIMYTAGVSIMTGWLIYRSLTKRLKGKKFAILGATAVGKTTVHTFLGTGEIPLYYAATRGERKTQKGTFKFEDLDLKIEEAIDIGGGDRNRKRWESIISNADYVCYLIRASDIYNDNIDYLKKCESEIVAILNHLSKGERRLYLLVSRCDEIPEYKQNNEIFEEKMRQKLRKLQKPRTELFIGSMVDKEEAQKLIGELIRKITEKI